MREARMQEPRGSANIKAKARQRLRRDHEFLNVLMAGKAL
jgi:hypothetical protein